jgi:O-acetyl-ADP-ribose deacetylase (regulator of RNase III)
MGKIVEVIEIDITKLRVDAIVNAANAFVPGGGGVRGSVPTALRFQDG